MNDKNHWYDGKFYDLFIAPNQDRLFSEIKQIIQRGSTVIDIGCGTGRFAFTMTEHCSEITGIDLSSKNISIAQNKLSQTDIKNITFMHANATGLVEKLNKKFDYSVLTYVIHEMSSDERITTLNIAGLLAKNIIIGDYLVPRSFNLFSLLNEVVEFAAGRDHYRNFRNFNYIGGLNGLAEIMKLEKTEEIRNNPLTSHIVVVKGK